MPANIVEGQDAEDVASYVGAVAGIGDLDGQRHSRPRADHRTAPAGGGGLAGDAAAGKAVFTSAGCVGCHTLADAGATGTVGPNLDDAKPAAALVVERVTNGKGAMPSVQGPARREQIATIAGTSRREVTISSVAGDE